MIKDSFINGISQKVEDFNTRKQNLSNNVGENKSSFAKRIISILAISWTIFASTCWFTEKEAKASSFEWVWDVFQVLIPLYAWTKHLVKFEDRDWFKRFLYKYVTNTWITQWLKYTVTWEFWERPSWSDKWFPSWHTNSAAAWAADMCFSDVFNKIECWVALAWTTLTWISRVEANKHTTLQVMAWAWLAFLVEYFYNVYLPSSEETDFKVWLVYDNNISEVKNKQDFYWPEEETSDFLWLKATWNF